MAKGNADTTYIAKNADVDPRAEIGKNVKIWNWVQVRENVKIGDNCILSKGVYIDANVIIGNNVKIQNNVSVYEGAIVEDGVFIGPHVCFVNDKNPRSINPTGILKLKDDWEISKTYIKYGSSLGANSTILCGVTVGKFALVGSGTVVAKSIPDYAIVIGNPAKIVGYACPCGFRMKIRRTAEKGEYYCEKCGFTLPFDFYEEKK
jgi:UDP-2-acetamido-3-amino-2,3-dideoxy-glucuronate N-acetyltransferase